MPHRLSQFRFRPGPIARTLAAALLFSSAALAEDAGLARCRAIVDATARLACYDALSLDTKPSQAAPAQPPAKPPAEVFGLEERAIAKDMLDQIDSRVQGKFEGWGPNSVFHLVNGQVWQVADGSSRFYDMDGPKVT